MRFVCESNSAPKPEEQEFSSGSQPFSCPYGILLNSFVSLRRQSTAHRVRHFEFLV